MLKFGLKYVKVHIKKVKARAVCSKGRAVIA